MKRFVIAGAAMLLMSCSFAADWAKIDQTQSLLVGAVEGFLGSSGLDVSTQHLPGYGLHVSFVKEYQSPSGVDVATATIRAVTALAGVVEGLDEDDWISVSVVGTEGYSGPHYRFLVRMKPGDQTTLQFWENSVMYEARSE